MYQINDTLAAIMIKCGTIAQIKPGQKLDTTGTLTIYNEGIVSWLFRKYYRDSKNDTLARLDELYRASWEQVKALTDSANSLPPEEILVRVAMCLYDSAAGILSLRTTYKGYPHVTARLEYILRFLLEPQYTHLCSVCKQELPKMQF